LGLLDSRRALSRAAIRRPTPFVQRWHIIVQGYNLISRFSEDIDIAVFRDDLGAKASVHELAQLTKTARSKRLDGIRGACQAYINESLLGTLSDLAVQTMFAIGRDPARLSIDPDPDDPDKQSLLIRYPSVADGGGYVRPFVKIESGAKSALDPNEARTITPYLSADLTDGDALAVVGVTTIDPERTFLDKVLILHGLPIFFEKNKRLYGAGQVSRHYYDIHRMVGEPIGKKACTDAALIEDCVNHARIFFNRRHTGLEHVKRGAFRLTPSGDIVDILRREYAAMATMIFGDVPDFRVVLDSVATAETWLNGAELTSDWRNDTSSRGSPRHISTLPSRP
jgi:Nucleotidyl transferase AbiEii toxin, Type IV TA system